jgi:hypothetical protein
MATHTTTTDDGTSRVRRALLAGAALVALAFGGVAVALTAGAGTPGDGLAGAPTPSAAPGSELAPPVTPGGGAAGRCVATYSLTTLAERDHAFAGTVTAIDGDAITFEVEESFRGDRDGTATLGGGLLLTGITPDSGPPLAVGDRVLVAGDGDFAWGCGFTQAYDEQVAAQWRDALAG